MMQSGWLRLAGFLSVFTLSVPLYSQDKSGDDGKEKRTHSGRKIVERTDAAGSSEVNRQDKKYYALAELIGFNPLLSMGVSAGYYLNPDAVMDLNYSYGRYDLIFFSVTSSTIALRYKAFVGNSFYWRLGGGYRQITVETTLEPLFGTDDVDSSGTASSIGLDGAIGNQWQWENFTIGCDWIGAFVPVSGSSSLDEPDDADKEDYEDESDALDKMSKRGHLQVLRFYLGASW